jgi:hypothetical protein
MVVHLFFALTVSIRSRLLFPKLCGSINTKSMVMALQTEQIDSLQNITLLIKEAIYTRLLIFTEHIEHYLNLWFVSNEYCSLNGSHKLWFRYPCYFQWQLVPYPEFADTTLYDQTHSGPIIYTLCDPLSFHE